MWIKDPTGSGSESGSATLVYPVSLTQHSALKASKNELALFLFYTLWRRKCDPASTDLDDGKVNRPFLKKLPALAEAAVVLVGAVPWLERPVSVLVSLADPIVLGDLPEVDIPTR